MLHFRSAICIGTSAVKSSVPGFLFRTTDTRYKRGAYFGSITIYTEQIVLL